MPRKLTPEEHRERILTIRKIVFARGGRITKSERARLVASFKALGKPILATPRLLTDDIPGLDPEDAFPAAPPRPAAPRQYALTPAQLEQLGDIVQNYPRPDAMTNRDLTRFLHRLALVTWDGEGRWIPTAEGIRAYEENTT